MRFSGIVLILLLVFAFSGCMHNMHKEGFSQTEKEELASGRLAERLQDAVNELDGIDAAQVRIGGQEDNRLSVDVAVTVRAPLTDARKEDIALLVEKACSQPADVHVVEKE